MTTIDKRLSRVIVGRLGISSHAIYPHSVIAQDFGADSLDRVELVMACEEEFGIEIENEEAQTAITFQEAVDLISTKVEERRS